MTHKNLRDRQKDPLEVIAAASSREKKEDEHVFYANVPTAKKIRGNRGRLGFK